MFFRSSNTKVEEDPKDKEKKKKKQQDGSTSTNTEEEEEDETEDRTHDGIDDDDDDEEEEEDLEEESEEEEEENDDEDEDEDEMVSGGYEDDSHLAESLEGSTDTNGEPEADYDDNPTDLYLDLEDKEWDQALLLIQDPKQGPRESRTWIFRRESGESINKSDSSNQNKIKNGIRWRILPIHATCVFRAPLVVIEALIEIYPQGVTKQDDQGMLPLHLACRNGASRNVVVTLLEAYPMGIHVKDRKGRTALDLALASSSQHREDVVNAIQVFLQKVEEDERKEKQKVKEQEKEKEPSLTLNHPANAIHHKALVQTSASRDSGTNASTSLTTAEVNYEHRTILFRLILKKDWSGALQRCRMFPEEASTYIVTKGLHGDLKFLPLHKLCVLQPPVDVVQALILAFPDGPAAKDQDGWLPIHCACYYGATDDVIELLMATYPKGAQIKDEDGGRYPLHYACIKNASLSIIHCLVTAYPKALLSKDDDGRLPIHYACSKGASSDILEALLQPLPTSAKCRDDHGRLPLHLACKKYVRQKTIAALLKAYPRAAQAKDDDDRLPLHYVCKHVAETAAVTVSGTPKLKRTSKDDVLEVVRILLDAYPESILAKDAAGSTPLMEARGRSIASTEMISTASTSEVLNLLEQCHASRITSEEALLTASVVSRATTISTSNVTSDLNCLDNCDGPHVASEEALATTTTASLETTNANDHAHDTSEVLNLIEKFEASQVTSDGALVTSPIVSLTTMNDHPLVSTADDSAVVFHPNTHVDRNQPPAATIEDIDALKELLISYDEKIAMMADKNEPPAATTEDIDALKALLISYDEKIATMADRINFLEMESKEINTKLQTQASVAASVASSIEETIQGHNVGHLRSFERMTERLDSIEKQSLETFAKVDMERKELAYELFIQSQATSTAFSNLEKDLHESNDYMVRVEKQVHELENIVVEQENRTIAMDHEIKIQSDTVDVLSGKLVAVEKKTKDHLNTFEDRMKEFESLLSEIAEATKEACQAINSSSFVPTSPRMKIEVSHALNQLMGKFSKAVELHPQQEYYSDSSVHGNHFS